MVTQILESISPEIAATISSDVCIRVFSSRAQDWLLVITLLHFAYLILSFMGFSIIGKGIVPN